MKNPDKTLVLFDVDGTILAIDSFFAFLKFAGLKKNDILCILFLKCITIIRRSVYVGYKQAVKEILLLHALKHIKGSSYEAGEKFSNFLLTTKPYNSRVFEIFVDYKNRINYEVCLVSASPDIWIAPLAKAWNVKYICTKCEIIQGNFTGKFSGKNCNRFEKQYRIINQFHLNEYSKVISFGNHPVDDGPMFKISDIAYLVKNSLIYCIKPHEISP